MTALGVDIAAVPGALDEAFGLPQPNWRVLYDHMRERFSDEQWIPAWSEAAVQWLTMLGARMGPDYRLRRAARFFTLDAFPDDVGNELLAFSGKALSKLEQLFAGLNRPEVPGHRVVIFFANRRNYYNYVAHYHPGEGPSATSSGMYVAGGYRYGHTICAPAKPRQLRTTVAHELAHHVLDHLELPAWIEEGLTQMMEERITGESHFVLSRELVRRHQEYWGRVGLQGFWRGEAYRDPEGQELAYNLSQVLVRRLAADTPKSFFAFVREANWADAGESAARAHLAGGGLQEIASVFLGPGDWAFRPDSKESVE